MMISELPYVSGRASLNISFNNGNTNLKSISVVRCPEGGVLLRLTLSKGWEDILFNALDKELQEEYRKVIPIRETTEA